MATEIELKARVQDSEALKALLHKKAEYSGAFYKEDTYWLLAPGLPAPPVSRLRIRREKRSLLGGNNVSATVVTYKTKEVRDGIEINDELEFNVNPGTKFEEFLKSVGFKPGTFKTKRGWDFSRDGVTAELVEVEGLGWFIELEILANDINAENLEESVAEAKQKLLGFLDELGISREAIESRYYTEMLKDQTCRQQERAPDSQNAQDNAF